MNVDGVFVPRESWLMDRASTFFSTSRISGVRLASEAPMMIGAFIMAQKLRCACACVTDRKAPLPISSICAELLFID